MRIAGLSAAVVLCPVAPVKAQATPERPLPVIEALGDRYDDPETPAEEEAVLDPRPRPWSIAPWVPLNWRSNLALAPRALRSGLAFEPEATIGRSWLIGRMRLLTKGSAFVSAIPSSAANSSSGWWLTAEAGTGDAATGAAPYATHEPLTLHDGVFGGRILTFHTITAGVRRRWGPTNINVFVRRRDSVIDALDRAIVGAQLSHTERLGEKLSLNIRTDAELRRYDTPPDGRRTDLFVRAHPPAHPVDAGCRPGVDRRPAAQPVERARLRDHAIRDRPGPVGQIRARSPT